MAGIGATIALITLAALVVIVATIARLIIIVPPNRAAVITGRRRAISSGQVIGYRNVIGGRTLRIPIVEKVDHLALWALDDLRDQAHVNRVAHDGGGDPDRPGKKDPLDPLVWQRERPGEPHPVPATRRAPLHQ